MLKINNISTDEFKNKILRNINKDTNLNINTSENSFVYKIMEALSNSHEEDINIINQLVSENNISDLKGKSLDNFFGLFNINRLGYSDGEYEFQFSYYGQYIFSIKANTTIEYNQKNYLIINNIDISSNESINTYKIKVKELNNINLVISDYIEISNIKIDYSGILNNEPRKNIFKKEIKENSVMNEFELLEINKENDDSFLNRGTNLFQTMSSDCNFKILNEIKNIENVFDAYFFEEHLTTYIVVIPNKLEYLKNIFSYSLEIIEFFKNKNIKLLKPNYVEFKIKNLKNLIPSIQYSKINDFIKSYIKNLYLKENTFKRNIFLNDLTNYLNELKIYNINLDDIEIVYEIYLECDLELLFEKNKIYSNSIKTFEPAIFVCQDVI